MRSVIPALIAISIASCAQHEEPASGPSAPASTAAVAEEVEVQNRLSVPVEVKGYRRTGGQVYIGTVQPHSTQRFVLPEKGVGFIYAVMPGGERVARNSRAAASSVQIRRVRRSDSD